MRPRLLITFLLSALTGLASADTNPSSPSVSDAAGLLSNAKIEGLKALPIRGLSIVKADGKTFFMSDNGRFVITGTLLDVWNRVAVTELDQVDQIANQIDLSKMKLKIDDLVPATVGTGKVPSIQATMPEGQTSSTPEHGARLYRLARPYPSGKAEPLATLLFWYGVSCIRQSLPAYRLRQRKATREK